MPTNANGVTYNLIYHAAGSQGFLSPANYDLAITYPDGGGSPTTITGIPPANVLTADGSLTAVSVLGSSVYVIPPGVTGNVDILANILGTSTFYVGGTANITGLADIGANTTINVDGGTAQLQTGIVASALSGATINLDNGGTLGNGDELLSALSGSTINFGDNGGTLIANVGGPLIDLSSTTITGFTAGVDKIEFANVSVPVDHYSITNGAGATQTIELFSSSGEDLGSVTVAGTTFATGTVHLGQSGPITVTDIGTTVTIDAAPSVFVCFLEGTRILTPSGEVNVEALKAGDFVLTGDGRTVPICWAGVTTASTSFVDPNRVRPIRICAGALAEGVPARDLYVSPDHSIYLDGALIPAQLLLNGKTVTQPQRNGIIQYYHIEVEPHDLIVAEGTLAESYLDRGMRKSLMSKGVVNLFASEEPKTWEDACAPLVLAGPILDQVRSRLEQRAEQMDLSTSRDQLARVA